MYFTLLYYGVIYQKCTQLYKYELQPIVWCNIRKKPNKNLKRYPLCSLLNPKNTINLEITNRSVKNFGRSVTISGNQNEN